MYEVVRKAWDLMVAVCRVFLQMKNTKQAGNVQIFRCKPDHKASASEQVGRVPPLTVLSFRPHELASRDEQAHIWLQAKSRLHQKRFNTARAAARARLLEAIHGVAARPLNRTWVKRLLKV